MSTGFGLVTTENTITAILHLYGSQIQAKTNPSAMCNFAQKNLIATIKDSSASPLPKIALVTSAEVDGRMITVLTIIVRFARFIYSRVDSNNRYPKEISKVIVSF